MRSIRWRTACRASSSFSACEAVRRCIRPEALTVEPLAVAAVFDLALLDRLVGLTVAILILKGAVELVTDLIRSAGEDEPDLSRWGFSTIEARRHRQTVRWLLYEIDTGRIHTRDQMMKEARAATDFSEIASFRALGIDEQAGREEKLERAASDAEAVVRRPLLRGLGLALRFGVSAVVFTAVHLLAGWVIRWLPELEVWAPVDGSCLLHTPALTVPGLHSGESLSFAQVVLLAAGLILFHLGRMLAHPARHILHHATEHRNERPLFLATTGPYASRRHPHAAGLILSSVGIAVGLHSVYLLVWAALAGAAQVFGARHEERALRQEFGSRWEEYARAVRRRHFGPLGWTAIVVVYGVSWVGVLA